MNLDNLFEAAAEFLLFTWPFFLFFVLRSLFTQAWLGWRNIVFAINTPYILLEIFIPREIKKNPRAMEQILLSLYSLKNIPGTFLEKWWDGEFPLSFALEMVSVSGETRLFVRIPKKYKPLVQAAFFSYYPDVEIEEVPDYAENLPANVAEVYARGFDLWGTEMILTKDPIIPIKTYPAFEAIEEEQQYDPISSFLEMLGKIRQGETFCIQYVITPAPLDWYKPWISTLERLKSSKTAQPPAPKLEFDFSSGPLPIINVKGGEVKEEGTKFVVRTPGETDLLKAIETNISKPAFNTIIRMLYMGPREGFNFKFARTGIVGIFNQYSGADINGFIRNFRVSTEAKFDIKPYIFPLRRANYRKNRMLLNYRGRSSPPGAPLIKLITSYLYSFNLGGKPVLLNTESLATLFHPPTAIVLTAPHVQRVTSRKAGPPAGMAIFGDEEEIKKYQ